MNRRLLTQQALPASLIILVACMLGLGGWAGQQVEQKLITQAVGETALYVSRLLGPPLPELAAGEALTPEHVREFTRLLGPTPLGHQIVAFKVWSPQGMIVFSNDAALIGRQFPVKDELARALRGEVVYAVSDLSDLENFRERDQFQNLLEIYSPVQDLDTGQVTAVIEYYQTADVLQQQLREAQVSHWKLIGGVTAAAGLLLAGVLSLSQNSTTQFLAQLKNQVMQLHERLRKSEEVYRRTREGGAGVLNSQERVMRQTEAALRAGPVQKLAEAVGQLGSALEQTEHGPLSAMESAQIHQTVSAVTQLARTAYQELVVILHGLSLPELETLSLAMVVRQAVAVFEQKSEARVSLDVGDLPEQAPAPVRLALYGAVSETLALFQRRFGSRHLHLKAQSLEADLHIEIASAEPPSLMPVAGAAALADLNETRWRVESLGGVLKFEHDRRKGARVRLEMPLDSTPFQWS